MVALFHHQPAPAPTVRRCGSPSMWLVRGESDIHVCAVHLAAELTVLVRSGVSSAYWDADPHTPCEHVLEVSR